MPPRALTLVLLLLAVAPAAFGDTAAVERTYLERVAITAADLSCNLFNDGERLALRSGLYQAEGELLRAKVDPGKLADMAADVRAHAKSLGCDSPDVQSVAGTIRSSYRQFAKTGYLEYPSGAATWGASRSEHDLWAVMQRDKKSDIVFGLHHYEKSPDGTRLAVAIPYDDKPPSSVKLFMRDTDKLSDPWLGSLFGPTGTLSAPPRAVSHAEWAGEMKEEEDPVHDWFNVYYFNAAATAHIELLDPREAVQLEITPSPLAKNKAPVTMLFEVGDLRAAHAFSLIPKPPVSQLAAAAAAAPAEGHE